MGISLRQKVLPQTSQWKWTCRSSSRAASWLQERQSSYLTLSLPSWMTWIRSRDLNSASVREMTDLSTVSRRSPISAIERGWSAELIALIIIILAGVGLIPAVCNNSSFFIRSPVLFLCSKVSNLILQTSCIGDLLSLHRNQIKKLWSIITKI